MIRKNNIQIHAEIVVDLYRFMNCLNAFLVVREIRKIVPFHEMGKREFFHYNMGQQ